jgi:hypothetical protein
MAARTTGMAGQAAPVAPAIGPVGQIVRGVGMAGQIVPIDRTDQTVLIVQTGPTVPTDRRDQHGRIAITREIGVVIGPTAART